MECENRLFVAYKPSFISSNAFLNQLKKRYKAKKGGFSGTLDPFAKGVLIIAFGQYTKLFQFLNKTPKTYKTVIWLGAKSESLDIEKIEEIKNISPFTLNKIKKVCKSLIGEVEYYPPKYSAKKINGKRAYKLARENMEFDIKKVKSKIYDIKILNYSHPFLSLEITVSQGGYIRSIGELIASKLHVNGTLTYLERVREGKFVYENEKALNPTDYLNLKENFYKGDIEDIVKGKKLKIENLKIDKNGEYFLKNRNLLSLIKIENGKVSYILNGIKLC